MSSDTKHRVDQIVRSETELDRMSPGEADQVWATIEERLLDEGQAEAAAGGGRAGRSFTPRRRLVLGIGLAAVVALTVTFALLPTGNDEGGKNFDLPSLQTASAAEVLAVASNEALGQASLFPGPGQRLHFKTSEIYSPREGNPASETTEEWIDASGLGERWTFGASSSGGSSGTVGSDSSMDRVAPLVTRFDVSEKPDPNAALRDSWRALLSMPELKNLPVSSAAALKSLRESASRAISRSPEIGPGLDRVVSHDLVVMMGIGNLLAQAPLDSGQRAAMFELLETSPDWFRSDGSAPMKIENLGEAEATDGRKGIMIRTSLDVAGVGAAMLGVEPGEWWFDILIDPASARLVETRNSEADGQTTYSTVTMEKLDLVDD